VIGRGLLAAAIAALALVAASPALAQSRRVAIIVGHNVGAGVRAPLRYAEVDATKMAAVLGELGGFAPADLRVLLAPRLSQVIAAIDAVAAELAQGDGATRTVLLFYYSGHSDGQALELGAERFPFGELRRRLRATRSAVRLAIVDSCKSGALLAEKGVQLGPAFDIRFTDDLVNSGEALFTSSAAHERALESQEIGGSFFSHHLVSGLRGAADASGDGRVTLAEAYQYAFVNTLSATSDTLAGPQHPGYEYGLRGQGELVLTDVRRRAASLELPRGFDRVVVTAQERGQVVAEVRPSAARRIAVPAGRYRVTAWRDGRLFARPVILADREERALRAEELTPATGLFVAAKGGEDPVAYASTLGIGGGLAGGVARAGAPLAVLDVRLRGPVRASWEAALVLGTVAGQGFRESAAFLLGGAGVGWNGGRLLARTSLSLGGGAIYQATDAGARLWTPALALVARAGGGVALTRRLVLTVDTSVFFSLLRRDDSVAVVPMPSVVVGLAVPLP
jgi:hypothetical protein